MENRTRLLLEVVHAVVEVFGANCVGVRLSPHGNFNDISDSNAEELFAFVVKSLNLFGLGYLHLIEPRVSGGGNESNYKKEAITGILRKVFNGTMISAGGYDRESGNQAVEKGIADLIAYGQRAKTPDIVNVSVVGGFVFGDSPKNGLAVIVTARSDLEAARRLAADIATRAWDMRHRFTRTLTSIDEAVAIAVANGKDETRPAVILGDVADNPGGGGGGNTTWLLSALYEAGAAGVFLGNLVDPAVAEAAHSHGEGATFEAVFNSTGETEFARRFAVPAAVEKLSAGACVGRRGIWAGRSISLGPSALLDVGGIKVVVASLRKQCADPVFFEMFGLDIAVARTVVVKSRGHFRAGFDEYFAPEQVYEVDAPGLTSPVLSRFAFKDLPRPVFPLDEDATWAGPPW